MIPVALVGWLVAYLMLAWCFRDALADEAPALGAAPPIVRSTRRARVVLAIDRARASRRIRCSPRSASRCGPSRRRPRCICVVVALAAACRCARSRAASAGSSCRSCSACSCSRPRSRAPASPTSSRTSTRARPPRCRRSASSRAIGSALINNHPMALAPLARARRRAGSPRLRRARRRRPRSAPAADRLARGPALDSTACAAQGVVSRSRRSCAWASIVTIPSLVASLAVLWLVAEQLPERAVFAWKYDGMSRRLSRLHHRSRATKGSHLKGAFHMAFAQAARSSDRRRRRHARRQRPRHVPSQDLRAPRRRADRVRRDHRRHDAS